MQQDFDVAFARRSRCSMLKTSLKAIAKKLLRFAPSLRTALQWAAFVLFPLVAAGQTLTITNGIQVYTALTNATVTMTGQCELRLTDASSPLSGCTINLNSPDAWLILLNVRPSVVSTGAANYLSQIQVNGAAAVVGTNVRVDEYVMGSVFVPQPPSYTPMQVFSNAHFIGSSTLLGLYTYYTNNVLGVMNKNIGSFILKRGYSCTLAQNADGTGVSQHYVAQDGDLQVGVLPTGLDHAATFVRVFPWRWTAKRGWADTAGDNALVHVYWFYDWGNGRTSTSDSEYAPMQWGGGYSTSINSKQKSTSLLGFNEPDETNQANLTVSAAISDWPNLVHSGLRLGSPAVSDSSGTGVGKNWLYSFMGQATNLGFRVDFVPIHAYCPSSSASALMSYLADAYSKTKRPIWLTEFNYQATWCGSTPTYDQDAVVVSNMIVALEAAPYVERYSIYNWVGETRSMIGSNGALTEAGILYRDMPSTMAYLQALPAAGSRGIAQFEFENNTLDSSGYGNNGTAVGIPTYAPGHTGQGIVLDGTNSYLQLPPTVATGTSFSFAAWVYWNGGANWQRIFDFGNDTTHYLFLTPSSGSSTLRFATLNGGSEQRVEIPSPLPVGQWVHVAFTLTGNTGKLYTNGLLAATSTITINPANFSPALNYLGKSRFAAAPLFNGELDEVQVADFAFTDAQVAGLMTDSPPQFVTSLLPRGNATRGTPYTNDIMGTASDPDPGDTFTYSKAGGPAWLNVGPDGSLSGTPGSSDGGTNFFTVRATDTAGASGFALVTVILPPLPIVNVSGTWAVDASGSWSDSNKWSSTLVANGAGFTADFSTLNITSDRTVDLDSSRSIGTLRFGDTSGAQNWIVSSTNNSVLTLNGGSLNGAGSIVVTQTTVTISASLGGTNGFTKSSSGTLVLSGFNTLSGTLNVDTSQPSTGNDGIVRLVGSGADGGISTINIGDQNSATSTLQLDGTPGDVGVAARFTVNCRNTSVATIENFAGTNTLSGNVSLGSGGSLFNIQSDTGLLIFSGTNQYGGSLTGSRSYAFSGAGNHLVSGPILNSTNGAPIALTKTGAGALTLSGVNTYTNGTTVSGGTLLVDGSIVSNVTVASGATLGGNGTINGAVTVANGATLSPGDSTGTLKIKGNLVLNSATLAYGLGASSDRTAVTGNLTLGGTLNVTDAGGFAAGTYTLFTYTGTLTYNGLTVGTLPAGFNATISTSTAGQVNLVVSALPPVASFTATPLNGVEPLQVIFTDTSTGSPTTWAWDFNNDGTIDSTGQNPTNTFAAGAYTVKLIACNGNGCGTNAQVNYVNVITALQSWQNFYGVPPDASDPFGVGMSNTNKFLAGFSPVSSAAYLHIINLAETNNDINVIYWGANGDSSYAGGPASRTNVLEFAPGAADGSYTNNFVSTGATDILSGGTGIGMVTNMVDPGGATNQPVRYYRVRVLVP